MEATLMNTSYLRLPAFPSVTRGPVSVSRINRAPRCALKPLESNETPQKPVTAAHAIPTYADAIYPVGSQARPVPLRDLSDEERAVLVQKAQEKIEKETHAQEEKLKELELKKHLDHELKFAKIMSSQGNYQSAMSHYDKVIHLSKVNTWHSGEATLQKAACLDKLGREAEARGLYESLVMFRAPYPDIKRRAAQALFGVPTEGGKGQQSPLFDDYMYRMFMSGFGTYAPKTGEKKREESEQEKVAMALVPWTILLMGPALAIWLLISSHTN